MVIRDGVVVHAQGYGLADLRNERPLTRATPFRLGSVSKQFTAMAIMILKERGGLSYDDEVTDWVPELERFHGIRVRHLLHHTSGLPDYYRVSPEEFEAVAARDGDPLLTNADAVSLYESWGEPLFEPGERYQYSNPGYEVLALIIERVSGVTFGAFLKENVFDRIGMATAVVRDRSTVIIPGRAVGYRPAEQEGGWLEHDDHFANWMVGAGGVYASLDDLYVWDQALYTERLVERETLDEAFSPAVLNDGTLHEYGFGWRLADRIGHRTVHHGGGWLGFRSSIIRFVDEQLTVIVLSNASANANGSAEQIAQVFLTR